MSTTGAKWRIGDTCGIGLYCKYEVMKINEGKHIAGNFQTMLYEADFDYT